MKRPELKSIETLQAELKNCYEMDYKQKLRIERELELVHYIYSLETKNHTNELLLNTYEKMVDLLSYPKKEIKYATNEQIKEAMDKCEKKFGKTLDNLEAGGLNNSSLNDESFRVSLNKLEVTLKLNDIGNIISHELPVVIKPLSSGYKQNPFSI